MKLEEALSKVAELEAKATETAQKLAELESVRNTGAMQKHALVAVLKAHNIPFSVEGADLSALKVDDSGAVAGEFAYTPPAVQPQPPQPQPEAEAGEKEEVEQGLTISDVKAMSEDQINERWDEVSAVLASQKEE